MNTGKLTQPFRALGLMHGLDRLRFLQQRWRNRRTNRRFRREYPGVALPPDYLMFESFRLDYRKYYEGGRQTAQWVYDLLRPYTGDWRERRVLDWGCGPGRIIRHLPELAEAGNSFFGADYNPRSIAWCRHNLPGIAFFENTLHPPLPFSGEYFDVIYGISIFTHLSGPNHEAWFAELMRVARPGAVLLLTTQGEVFRRHLTGAERAAFDRSELVVRGKAREGHRVYSAFHPPAFLRTLFGARADVLEHRPGREAAWGLEQDTWILRKR